MKQRLAVFALTILFACGTMPGFAQNQGNTVSLVVPLQNSQSFGQGEYYVPSYNYSTSVYSGGSTTAGVMTVTVFKPFVILPDKRQVAVFSVESPITIGNPGATTSETLTPTAVSAGCNQPNAGTGSAACQITLPATTYAHGPGDQIISGTFGLQEAIEDAFSHTGGQVIVDGVWAGLGGTSALLAAAIPYQSVGITDLRGPIGQPWLPTQAATTVLGTPTTLTTTTQSWSTTPAGLYTTAAAYFSCIAYVDIMGQEGPCSGSFSSTPSITLSSAIFSAPAASTGAVGWIPYIGITAGGSATALYQVPLTVLATGASNGVCVLNVLETTTPACALKNTNYGVAAGSGATVSALTLVTSQINVPAAGATDSSTYLGPNSNARTTYAYAPAGRLALAGVPSSSIPFPAAAAPATTVPAVLGTLNLPPGFMDYVGREIEVCGYMTMAASTTATIENIIFYWDANGSNATAGFPVLLTNLAITSTLVTAHPAQYLFCQDFMTSVSGTTATAGSIQPMFGWFETQYTTGGVATVPTIAANQAATAVASLNLAGAARLEIVQNHTTGTDGVPTLQNLTVKVLN